MEISVVVMLSAVLFKYATFTFVVYCLFFLRQHYSVKVILYDICSGRYCFNQLLFFVCEHGNLKSYGWIFVKFWGIGSLWMKEELIKFYKDRVEG